MVSDGSQVMRERSARAWVLNGLVLCLSVSPAVRHSGDAWPRVPFFYPALWALLLAWYVWSQLRPRLRLTPVGLELLGEHARRILWSEITRIEVEDKSRLVVHLADGQRVKLRHRSSTASSGTVTSPPGSAGSPTPGPPAWESSHSRSRRWTSPHRSGGAVGSHNGRRILGTCWHLVRVRRWGCIARSS
ncbi:hypothetical protein ACFQ0G_48315 [Streptomyces chiangmaiensis]